jgi:hypothetical protein
MGLFTGTIALIGNPVNPIQGVTLIALGTIGGLFLTYFYMGW